MQIKGPKRQIAQRTEQWEAWRSEAPSEEAEEKNGGGETTDGRFAPLPRAVGCTGQSTRGGRGIGGGEGKLDVYLHRGRLRGSRVPGDGRVGHCDSGEHKGFEGLPVVLRVGHLAGANKGLKDVEPVTLRALAGCEERGSPP